MEIEKIIEDLNKRAVSAGMNPDDVTGAELTESEKTFLRNYEPGKALIIYGSLASGQPNHSVVEHIRGKWKTGIVRGKLEKKGWGADLGYYAFRPAATGNQEEIPAVVLFSDELVANWQMLDEFEGAGYRRILAKYELEDGQAGVGYIYATSED